MISIVDAFVGAIVAVFGAIWLFKNTAVLVVFITLTVGLLTGLWFVKAVVAFFAMATLMLVICILKA